MIRPKNNHSIRGLLLLLAGSLALTLPLAADPSDEETKVLKQAQQSYDEGAFDVCNDRVTALLKKFPKSELIAPIELLQAKALFQLGHDDTALAAFTVPLDQLSPDLQAETLFWQGQILVDSEKWPEAEQKYRALLALKDANGHTDEANLGLAWALFKQGKEADALPLITTLAKDKTKVEESQRAQLLLAKIQLSKQQNKEAVTNLEALLAQKLSPALNYETSYWLGEAYVAAGEFDAAATAFQRVTVDPQAFPKPLVAQAYLGLGGAEHALRRFDLAAPAYEKAYQLAENDIVRLIAFHAYLSSARASNQLPEAVATLQEFAKTSEASAPIALFAIGTELAEDRSDDKAIGILESMLVAYGTSPIVPLANEQLGELYARTDKPDLAVKAFQACIAAASDPALVRAAHFQLGSVLFKMKDYAEASAQFTLVSDGTDATSENASFNLLLAQANLGKADVFLKGEPDFLKRFPKSAHLKALALAEGRLLINAGKTDDAKLAFQRGIALEGTGPDQKTLLKALADLQYQTNDLEGTIKTCQTIVDQFPNDSLDAAQRGILVSYELKKLTDDQVEQYLVQLGQKYAKSPDAPESSFRLGEFYFYRGNYVKAQEAFQQLTSDFPQSDYANNAYFFAGRSAFEHQDYAGARALLDKVPDGSPFKPDARLWEGRSYQQQLNFSQAATLYDAVLATEKTGSRFVQANLLKGECFFEMGAKDPSRYSAAVDAFGSILKTKEGTIADRNEAAVRSAKCLEKLNRPDDAMALYLDVLWGRVAGDDASAKAPPEFSWQIESGWQAARIREASKDWRGAIEIYKRLEQIGGAHQLEFHDLINKLRRDNYIYE